MKKLLKTLALVAIFGVVLYAVGALAASESDAVETALDKLGTTFQDVKKIFFVLAAFGIIGLAAAALLGKIQWKWLWALIFGVAIVAGAGMIVEYATGDELGADVGDTIADS